MQKDPVIQSLPYPEYYQGRQKAGPKVFMTLYTARDLGYKINSNQYLNIDIPIDIALVTQHDAEEFYSCLYESFDRISSKMNIQVSIHSAKHSTNLIEQIRRISNSYDGIILMAPTLESEDYEMIAKSERISLYLYRSG